MAETEKIIAELCENSSPDLSDPFYRTLEQFAVSHQQDAAPKLSKLRDGRGYQPKRWSRPLNRSNS